MRMKYKHIIHFMNSDAGYHCFICNKRRILRLNTEKHKNAVSKSPNGLALYSDIHRCSDGILGINNLHIDHDFAVRSYSILELPTKKIALNEPGIPVPGVPAPGPPSAKGTELNTYQITDMLSEKGFRLAIVDERLNISIKIGKPEKGEMMISYLTSDLGTVILEYYASEIAFSSVVEKWMILFVNLLEILPPTKIGLFIETLRFIHSNFRNLPSPFLIKQLKTILVAHETYFTVLPVKVRYKRIRDIKAKYGEEYASLTEEIIEKLEENPMMTLQDFTKDFDRDIVFLIYVFLILDQEAIIGIEWPGVIDG